MSSNRLQTEPAWRAQYPFAPQWLTLPEGRMHYIDTVPRDAAALPGDQPTMLFVHGNPTWSFHWRRPIHAFSDRCRAVAIDHLGCGLSDKPARRFRLADRIEHLTRLIESLNLRDVTLVAQDWGGAIGLGAMLRCPERLSRIVLLNTGAFPPPFVPWRINVCRTPLLGRLALQGGNVFSRAAVRMTTSRSPLPADVAAAYLAPYDNWSNRRAVAEFVADIPTSPRHPTWETLTQIEAGLPSLSDRPSLLVWGMRDWCFTPACLRRFQSVWPDATTVELADAGHWVMEDAADDVLAAMDAFLPAAVPGASRSPGAPV